MVPAGEHRGTYNAQYANNPEVAVVLDDTATAPRDIVIKQRDDGLTKISEFHASYDALQYPLLFPTGERSQKHNFFQFCYVITLHDVIINLLTILNLY